MGFGVDLRNNVGETVDDEDPVAAVLTATP